MSKVYCIDLGTSTLKIYLTGAGLVYNQKNVLAIIDKNRIIATGDEAWDMAEKAPSNIEVIQPVRVGVLAQVKNMIKLLDAAFDKIGEVHGKTTGQEVLLAIPTYATQVEKMALVNLMDSTELKPKKVRVVNRPVADALGVGIDLKECFGTIIVDVGAETTEISVVTLGGLITDTMLPIGGRTLDECIISDVRLHYNFMIGRKTAEQIKIKLGTATVPTEEENKTMKAFGRDVVSGLPGSFTIDSEFVYWAIKENLDRITDAVKIMYEHAAPEVSADIYENGIYITGGVAAINNFDKMLEEAVGLKVTKCENGSVSAALGLGKIGEDPKLKYFADDYISVRADD